MNMARSRGTSAGQSLTALCDCEQTPLLVVPDLAEQVHLFAVFGVAVIVQNQLDHLAGGNA
jgi:hypothetical protein